MLNPHERESYELKTLGYLEVFTLANLERLSSICNYTLATEGKLFLDYWSLYGLYSYECYGFY